VPFSYSRCCYNLISGRETLSLLICRHGAMHLCKNIGSQLYKSCLQNTYRSHPVRPNEWLTDWLAEWRMELMKVYWAHGIDWAIEGAGDAMWWSGWMGGHFAELNEFCQLSGNGNTAPTIRDVWGCVCGCGCSAKQNTFDCVNGFPRSNC